MIKHPILFLLSALCCLVFYILGKLYSDWFVIPQAISTVVLLWIIYIEEKETN